MGKDYVTTINTHAPYRVCRKLHPKLWLAKDPRYSQQFLGEGSSKQEALDNLNEEILALALPLIFIPNWDDKKILVVRS